MSERPMAQRHEWPETVIGTELLYRVCRSGPEVLFEVEQNGNRAQAQAFLKACRELLRVVAERDEARQALQEMEDAHSEETGERCRAEDERDALGKALLRYVTGDECGCCDGSSDQPPSTKQCAYCEAQAALHDAGLLPEEDGAPTGRQEDRERP